MNLEKVHIDYLLSDFKQDELAKIVLCHSGSADSATLDQLLLQIETKLNENVLDKKVRKGLFNVVVEGVQNIERHAIEHPEVGGIAFFALIESRDEFNVTFGNLVTQEIRTSLKQQLAGIAELTSFELKEKYRNQLSQGELSEKGGGGLGLMAMQLKSDAPAKHNFIELAPGYFFFLLRYAISKF
jgi:hypothetical protein